MTEQFIGEAIKPILESFDHALMAQGIPGMPGQFSWRGKTYRTSELIRTWRSTGPCRHGSGEKYVRRHWFKIRTDTGEHMTVYFDKSTRGKRKEMGWYLFSIGNKE